MMGDDGYSANRRYEHKSGDADGPSGEKKSGGKGFNFKFTPKRIFLILFVLLGIVFLFVNLWIGISILVAVALWKFYTSFASKERFKMLGGGFRFTILIIVIVGFIWLFTFGWGTPWVQSNIVPVYENVKLTVAESSVGGFFSDILNPGDELRRYGSFEDEELKREEIGVEMSKLGTVEPKFPSGGPITVQSKIKAKGISEESSNVYFTCELDTYTGDVSIEPYGKDNPAILPSRGGELEQTISCTFEDGLITTTTSDTQTAKLTATFDSFYSQAVYPLVFAGNKDFADNINLKEYSSDETGVFVNDIGYSIVSPGPIKFEVGVDREQPFIDGDVAFLEVNVEADSRVNLKKIESFGLFVPGNNVRLRTDKESCAFEPDGIFDEEFAVYRLKDEFLEKLSEECKTKSCRDGKKDITLSCYFDVDAEDVFEKQGNFVVEAYYSFDIYTTNVVTVRKAVLA